MILPDPRATTLRFRPGAVPYGGRAVGGGAGAPPRPPETAVLPLQRGTDLRQVMEAVAHRVILEEELAGERGVSVHRVGRDAVEIGVADGTNRRRRRRAVLPQQGERIRLRHGAVLAGVL